MTLRLSQCSLASFELLSYDSNYSRPAEGRPRPKVTILPSVECSKKFGGLLLPVCMLTNGSSGLSHVTGRRSS